MPTSSGVATYELKTIQQAVEVGTTLTGSWFRGHPCTYDQLTPSVFRENLLATVRLPEGMTDTARAAEAHFAEGFRLKAPSVEKQLPPEHDWLSWLFLMQHHGTPTRLLDWTENVLVALYFSIRESKDKDGELWAMVAPMLAIAGGVPGMPSHHHVTVKYLAAQSMNSEPEHVSALLGAHYDDTSLYPLPIFAPLAFPRMVAQASAFTIHPRPQSGNSIPELLRDEKHLVRYLIPAAHKKQLTDDLLALGIHELAMFPSLDGLSTYLRQELERPQCAQVDPPRWD
jgi:hypothetical protein